MHVWQNYYTEKQNKNCLHSCRKWGKRVPDNASYFSSSVFLYDVFPFYFSRQGSRNSRCSVSVHFMFLSVLRCSANSPLLFIDTGSIFQRLFFGTDVKSSSSLSLPLSRAICIPWQSSSARAAFTNQLRTPTHRKMMMRQQNHHRDNTKRGRELGSEGPGCRKRETTSEWEPSVFFYALLPHMCSSSGSTMSLSRSLPPFLHLSLCCHHSVHFPPPPPSTVSY